MARLWDRRGSPHRCGIKFHFARSFTFTADRMDAVCHRVTFLALLSDRASDRYSWDFLSRVTYPQVTAVPTGEGNQPMSSNSTTRRDPITRDDLESGFRSFQGEVMDRVEDRRSTLVSLAAGAGLVLMILVFLLGRRSGRKKTTLVEVRRY
jgi:hypothetical protein